MGLDSDVQDILEMQSKSSSARSATHAKISQLIEKIKGGQSTGDKIRDFVIVNLGSISPDAAKPYRETEARLRNSAGSQILVVKQEEAIHGCPGIIAPEYIDPMFVGIDTELTLGILTSGLDLDVLKGEIIFPTQRHARRYDRFSGRKWELQEGPISLNWYDFMRLGNEVERRRTPMPNDLSAHFERGLMINVGEEVEQYFGKNGYLDTSYLEALNLLGQEAPERFRKKHDGEIQGKRLEIISKLEGLTEREATLNGRIKSIYGSIKHGGFMEGGAISVVEDEDDARVVSTGPRMRLQETTREIQRYLKQAIELRMHRGDLRIEQKPGVEVNVPVYISSMCEKYQVEIPA